MRKIRTSRSSEPQTAYSVESGPVFQAGLTPSSRAASANKTSESSPARSAQPSVSVEVPGIFELKGALVLEGLLAPEKAFPPRQGVTPLPCVDDLELAVDLPVVTSVDEPVRYAGGRYDLPPAVEVEPGMWTAEVKFGANGRWIRRLQVEGVTQADAETTARRVFETAVKNRVSLENAHAAVSGKAPSA